MCRAETEAMTTRQRAHIMALCSRVDLDQEERRELAEYVIGRRTLSGATKLEARRIIDALNGYVAIQQLHAMRAPGASPKAPKPAGRPVYAVDDTGRSWVVGHR